MTCSEQPDEPFVLKLTVVVDGDETGALLAWQHAGHADLTPRVAFHGRSLHGWPYTIQSMCPGSPMPLHGGSRHLHAAAAAAAHLHLPSVGLPDIEPVVQRRLCAPTDDRRLWRTAADVAACLEDLPGHRTLIHGDYAANNVLYGDSGIRVIDPSGHTGPPGYDLARYVVRSCPDMPVADGLAVAAETYTQAGGDLGPNPFRSLAVLAAAELCDLARWDLKPTHAQHLAAPRNADEALDAAETLIGNTR